MTKIPVALQMYSLRDECEKDFVGTIEKSVELLPPLESLEISINFYYKKNYINTVSC